MPTWKVNVKIERVDYGYVTVDAPTAGEARIYVEDNLGDCEFEDTIVWEPDTRWHKPDDIVVRGVSPADPDQESQ